jgi:phage shock protein A
VVVGIAARLAQLFRVKANKALDRAEDPREVMDYSYERQLELLTQVRRGVADVATSRKRLELQLTQLHQSSGKLQSQAERAVRVGRDDVAREALTRRATVHTQIDDIEAQRSSLRGEEEKLQLSAQRLQTRVEAFRTRKETIKATYTAAEAQTTIGEAVSGISEEMGDVGLAMQRAEDKTAQMQARAGALDELLASGALEDASRPAGRDDTQATLDAADRGADVELELASLKAHALPAGATPGALSQHAEPHHAEPHQSHDGPARGGSR